MIESTIRDYKTEVVNLVSALQETAKGSSQDMSAPFQEIYAALEKSKPSLMFYGIYNAGKSSLLNAIFGETVASVNDIPETHKVTRYPWNGYDLIDTPGLNGPKDDEAVTLAEIQKHDVIMFVIDDSDNFDSDVITHRIVEILEARKPCIIVINRKNDSTENEILEIKNKINQNIKVLSNVPQNYDFVAVDAESALRARREDKNALLADSGIDVLESLITKKLQQVSSIQLLRTPIEMSLDLCAKMRERFSGTISNSEAAHLNDLLQKLYYVKAQIAQEFTISLQSKIRSYGDQIYQQAKDSGKAEIATDSYAAEISALAQLEMTKFAQESKTTLDTFTADWKLELNDLPDMPDKPSESDCKTMKAEPSRDEIDRLLDIIEIICKDPVPVPIPEPPIPIPVPVPILVEIVRTIENLLLGQDKQEEIDPDEWNRMQQEYVQKRELALRELRNRIDMSMSQFQQNVLATFNQQLDKAYENATAEIKKLIEEQQKQDSDAVKKQETVSEIESKLKTLDRDIKTV